MFFMFFICKLMFLTSMLIDDDTMCSVYAVV